MRPSVSHVSLHPLRMPAVGVVRVLRGVGEASGAAVLPQSSLRPCGSRAAGTHANPRAPHPWSNGRSHPIHFVGRAGLQGRQAGWGETHAIGLVVRRVAVIVVSQLGSGVQEAALSLEIAGDGGGVSWRLLALAAPGEGVELGIADVGKSRWGPGIVAGLRSARGGERTGGDGGSAAGCRS